ncbi:ATP-binding cassette domain-containing protein [Thiobaca trueperi]|uniref:ABC-type lipoprotein export system ATPase subunit n=1 Tax=Thiobaca trueperi TaxID=127458 RepID=A0A4R3N772_9GAMM|nr:ATP-binding cassette domain-containing protein [Thiobaca trueperi]TCT24261.1 ABC-type lipoprotein export system ATPase subunit [Thiobaca trueperi]
MNPVIDLPLERLTLDHPCVSDFLASLGFSEPDGRQSLRHWLDQLADEDILDAGMERHQILDHVQRLIREVQRMEQDRHARVDSLTLIGGRNKQGEPEPVEISVRAGQILCIVGPTGSGKSRLLADIECLAQGDTPTGRRILVNGQTPAGDFRHALDRKLVAQLSQNMNFVVDLSAREFIGMHAQCRMVNEPQAMVERVIACANDLTGEKFSPETSVTQLSGGQTRALMIADVALLSASPVVLIDEIENAGVDRQRALELLVTGEKIVFISTHDPLLALRGDRRIVIRNGGIVDVLTTSALERENLNRIEAVDATLMNIRDRLRRGLRIEEPVQWPQ